MENKTSTLEENALDTNHVDEAVMGTEEANTGIEQAPVQAEELTPEELANIAEGFNGINLNMEELSKMTPEEIERVVAQSMQPNLGNSINQESINKEFFGEERYQTVYELIKTKLSDIIADVTPENNRNLFFSNLAALINETIAFEQNEETNSEYTLGCMKKLFKLIVRHFALFLSLEAGGQGLRLHSDALFTNLIYDMFTNTFGVNTLLQNFGENVKELAYPEHRLMDMAIVNPVVIASVIGSLTLVLNKLIALEVMSVLPVDVESTLEQEVTAFIKVFEEL